MLPEYIKRFIPSSRILQAKAYRERWTGEPELRLLRTLVDPARESLDIGAADGIYTYFLSRRSKHVHAYEPNPKFCEFIANAGVSNTTVHNVAASDHEGEAILSIPIINGVRYPWRARVSDLAPLDATAVPIRVALRRLDEMGHTNVGFIKIDVEGQEAAVLRGASRIIERNLPTLLIEIEQSHIQQRIHNVFDMIAEMGYAGFFLKGGVLRSIATFDLQEDQLKHADNPHSRSYINNFIFFPRGTQSGSVHAAWLAEQRAQCQVQLKS